MILSSSPSRCQKHVKEVMGEGRKVVQSECTGKEEKRRANGCIDTRVGAMPWSDFYSL